MSVVSDIEIRLRADIARLQQDMTQARNAVGGAMTSIRNAVGTASKALAGLAVGLGVGAFASWIKGAIDAVDAIGDISPATGVAIKDLAGLQLAFQFGGVEAKALETTMIKLSTAIASGDASFNRIKVATRTATKELRSSKDVLYDVADAFANLQDGTAKTALATELFGKTGAALIPMLNGGSEGLRNMAEMADKLGLSFTQAGVDAAGKFNDSMDTLGLITQGVGRQVAMQLLPTLNDLLGSFVKLATEGGAVRKMADVIGVGFKAIYTGAVVVGEVFNTLSSIIAISIGSVMDGFGTVAKTLKFFIEGEYTKAWEAANTGARGVVNNAKNLAGDMTKSWSASAAAITGVWDGTSGKLVEDFAAMGAAGKLAAQRTKEQEEAAKKAAAAAEKAAAEQRRAAEQNAAAYASLLGSIEERIYASEREANGLAALTQSQEMHRDLDKELASGKLVLTASEIRYARSLLDTLGVNEQIIEANKKRADDEKEWVRIREQAAQAQEESAKKDAESHAEFWNSINSTAQQTFRSITEGGAALGKRLRDTLKNTFFDWLYQMTAKKWIINVQTATAPGGAGLSSLIGAATGGNGVMGAVGNLYSSLAGGATMAGGLGTGFLGSLAGGLNGAGVGSGLASSLGLSIGNSVAGVLGPTISGALSSGLGALASAMPWVAGAAAVYAVAKKAFGHGPKETTGTGITGTFGADSFSGQGYTEWQKKGGWFSSTKRGTDPSAMDAGMATALNDAYKGMKESAAGFAQALGVPVAAIDNYSKQIKLAFTGDAAKDQAALAAVLEQVGDELAGRVVPNLERFAVAGETAGATLARVVAGFQTVDAVLAQLGATSQVAFGAVGVASLDARERLLTLSGGVQAFAEQAAFFEQNFVTEAQRLAPVQKAVTEGLANLGYAGTSTTEQFGAAVTALVASGALATQAGAETYAGLMALAPAFKLVADAAALAEQAAAGLAAQRRDLDIQIMELTGDTLGALAARRAGELAAVDASLRGQYQRIYALQDEQAAAEIARAALEKANTAAKETAAAVEEAFKGIADGRRAAVGTAFAALQSSIERQKGVLQQSFDALMAGFDRRIGASTERIAEIKTLRDLLQGANVAAPTGDVARQQARAQISAALQAAKSTGMLPSADSLQDALRAVQQDATDQFSSLVDYRREQLRTDNQIQELSAMADNRLTVEQNMLQALMDQKALAQAAYAGEIAKLDEMAATAKSQLDAINGVTTAVLSIKDAWSGFTQSMGLALSNPVIAAQKSVTSQVQVEQLYNSLLGRASDAAGMSFYLDAIKNGTSLARIEQGFRESPEYLKRNASIYSAQSGGTMSQGESATVAALGTLNTRMENMEKSMAKTADSTGQFANEFSNATGGGGPLMTMVVPG